MRLSLTRTMVAGLAFCCAVPAGAQSLEQEKLRLLACDFQGADTPARREAVAWRDALLASGDKGEAALTGPFWLGGACFKQVSLDRAGAAGKVCNDKPAAFAKAMKAAGVTLDGGKDATEKDALLFKETDEVIYIFVEGVFGTFLSVEKRPGIFSFLCVAGRKEK